MTREMALAKLKELYPKYKWIGLLDVEDGSFIASTEYNEQPSMTIAVVHKRGIALYTLEDIKDI